MKIKKKSGAQLGNKNAVGHGSPPNPGYADEDLIKLGEEFIIWTKMIDETNTEIVHLSEWYSRVKDIPRSQWQSIVNRSCFRGYYEKALDWMGSKIMKNKNLSPTYGSRFLGIYYPQVAEQELDQAKRKIDYEFEKKMEFDKKFSTPPNDDHLETKLELIRKEGELQKIRSELEALKETLAK